MVMGFHANGANGGRHNGPKPNERQASANANSGADDLDTRILALEKAVGPGLYRSVLRVYSNVEHQKLIREPSTKRRVPEILESAACGVDRLSAVRKRIDPKTLASLIAKLQAPALAEIADMKTIRNVVFGLAEFADSPSAHTG
jgi:hypothetical protein